MPAVPTTRNPIPVYAGDTFEQPFVFRAAGLREDLSAWTGWRCHWRADATPGTAVPLTVDASQAANGQVLVTATPVQTRAMAGPGVADVEALDGTKVRTFVRFRTSWTEDVTRD